MTKRWSFFAVSVLGLVLIVLALFLTATAQGEEPPPALQSGGSGIRQSAPTILAVHPNEAPNNLDTAVVITGTGFQAVLSGTQVLTTPVVSLDGFDLADTNWVSSQNLTATVPWGLDPGVYTVTIMNPDGQFGSKPDAFTVTQAIGVWTTGGPYGGMVTDMAVSPTASETAFALTGNVGLFRTEDGGDNWDLALYDPIAWGVEYGIAPTHTLYFWGLTGLWRSDDEGVTFQQVLQADVTSFATDPDDEQKLWIGAYPNHVLYSADGGVNWEERRTGLPDDAWASELLVDPWVPSTLYAVLSDGRVFKTTNAGTDWLPASDGLPAHHAGPPYTLAIHPSAPSVLLWAQSTGGAPAHRSTNGGQSWSPVQIELENTLITDLAFSPYVSGTVYGSLAGTDLVGISTDGGATWGAFAPRGPRDHVISIGLDPATGLPAYLGGIDSGVSRSLDGGHTWELATHGITGLRVVALAAVPGWPENVYAGGAGAGGFVSNNAGHSWQQLPLPYAWATAIELDPLRTQRILIHSGSDLFRTQDAGATWENVHLPQYWQIGLVETMAVARTDPDVVYAAGRDNNVWNYGGSLGVAYGSDDFGASWQPLNFTLPISAVSDILVSPINSQTVYVAAGAWAELSAHPGKGIFRSTDAGETWQKSSSGMEDLPAFSLAIHPDHPQTIYATAWLTGENRLTVFRSVDGGDSWAITGLRAYTGYPHMWRPSVAIDPLKPDTVYVGAQDGLYRTDNGGITWTKAAGELGQVEVTTLDAKSDEKRTILYVATIGGLTAGTGGTQDYTTAIVTDGFVEGGVYQQTIVNRSGATKIYLPLVLKNR